MADFTRRPMLVSHVKPKVDIVTVVYSLLFKGTIIMLVFKTIHDVFSNPNQVVVLPKPKSRFTT